MSVPGDPAAESPGDDWDAGHDPARDLASGGAAGRTDRDGAGPAVPPEGLYWSDGPDFHELDLDQLLEAVGATPDEDPAASAAPSTVSASPDAGDDLDSRPDAAPESRTDADAQREGPERGDAALETREPGDGTSRNLTAAIAEQLPTGPALARLLSGSGESGLSDWDLPGVVAAYRRLASWAQAGELAAVAQIASRTAARDDRVPVTDEGRPGELLPSAVDEVSLALTMSHVSASWWSGLALDLRWRLAATGAALAAGTIDVARARLISEATTPLADELARAVEARVLPQAGSLTTGQLRAALRRAVIVVDPRGADDRRRDAERQARVRLYVNESDTASLIGANLPTTLAAAGMARINAMARALKAAQGGRLDELCAYVFLGLLTGTMPLIPPPPGAPPDPDAPGTAPGPGTPPAPGTPDGPGAEPGPGPGPDGGESETGGPSKGHPPDGLPGSGPPRAGRPASRHSARRHPAARRASRGNCASDPPRDGPPTDPDGSWRDVPLPPDPDPPDPGPPDPDPPDGDQLGHPKQYPGSDYDDDDDGRLAGEPGPAWPALPFSIGQRPPVFGRPPGHAQPGSQTADTWPRWDPRAVSGSDASRPRPGLLDLTIGWHTLVGRSAAPADLGRIGPVSASQALPLAAVAALHPGTTWRVILIDPGGVALAVERVRRRSRSVAGPGPLGGRFHNGQAETSGPAGGSSPAGASGPGSNLAGGPWLPGVVGRVTVVLPLSTLDGLQASGRAVARSADESQSGLPDGGIRAAIWRAAIRAARRVRQAAAEGAGPAGPCTHASGTTAYRPTTLIREHVEARDRTCRQPTCGQPAWRTDLDHTRPWDQGGATCPCNLGPRCRRHHQIKQLPGWALIQPEPGTFHLTTPAGRTYLTRPDAYPV